MMTLIPACKCERDEAESQAEATVVPGLGVEEASGVSVKEGTGVVVGSAAVVTVGERRAVGVERTTRVAIDSGSAVTVDSETWVGVGDTAGIEIDEVGFIVNFALSGVGGMVEALGNKVDIGERIWGVTIERRRKKRISKMIATINLKRS
jgi:hypothetical protein